MLLAIDPGTTKSAYVIYNTDNQHIVEFGIRDNTEICVKFAQKTSDTNTITACAIEMIASYGMPVGADVFITCTWIGRFQQALWQSCRIPTDYVFRQDVKLHLCRTTRAKDANIRQALIDRYGGKDAAIGVKAAPGPLYGVKADVWSALAVAITRAET